MTKIISAAHADRVQLSMVQGHAHITQMEVVFADLASSASRRRIAVFCLR